MGMDAYANILYGWELDDITEEEAQELNDWMDEHWDYRSSVNLSVINAESMGCLEGRENFIGCIIKRNCWDDKIKPFDLDELKLAPDEMLKYAKLCDSLPKCILDKLPNHPARYFLIPMFW